MLARTPVERIVLSVAGVGIGVLGAMGIDREAARSTLISGGGREPGIPGALVPSDVTAKTARQVRC